MNGASVFSTQFVSARDVSTGTAKPISPTFSSLLSWWCALDLASHALSLVFPTNHDQPGIRSGRPISRRQLSSSSDITSPGVLVVQLTPTPSLPRGCNAPLTTVVRGNVGQNPVLIPVYRNLIQLSIRATFILLVTLDVRTTAIGVTDDHGESGTALDFCSTWCFSFCVQATASWRERPVLFPPAPWMVAECGREQQHRL